MKNEKENGIAKINLHFAGVLSFGSLLFRLRKQYRNKKFCGTNDLSRIIL